MRRAGMPTWLAGVVGVLVVLVLAGGLAYAVRRRGPAEPTD